MIRRPVAALSYAAFMIGAIATGAFRIARAALSGSVAPHPAIVEFPLRCHTDGEITAMAGSITITPGTLVVGTAAGGEQDPPTLFVHAMFGGTREELVDELRDMETRLLAVTRGGSR